FATDLTPFPVDLKVDPAGSLYYLARGSGATTGVVSRVSFTASPAPLADDDAQFLSRGYTDLLGRPPDVVGQAGFGPPLNADHFRALGQVAADYVTSAENRGNVVQSFYTGLLGRPAGGGEVGMWLQVMQQGVTPDQVRVAVVSSGE